MDNPGMSPEIRAAIMARSQQTEPAPALDQQTQPGANVPPPPMPPAQMTSALPQGMNQSSGQGKAPNSEAEMILKAMSQRLSAINEVDKAGVKQPEIPQPPMGGGSPYMRY